MAQPALNQRTCVKVIHVVVEIAPTLAAKTGPGEFWLQLYRHLHSLTKKKKFHCFGRRSYAPAKM